MRTLRKFLLWFLIVISGLAVIVFVAASVYINQFKPQLEKALTENIGLQTKIDGSISLKVLPGLSFIAKKVRVISNETYVLRVVKTEISIEVTPLFSGEVNINALHFTEPQVFVIRNEAGIYNYEELYAQANRKTSGKSASQVDKLDINLEELTITNGSILYVDKANGDTLSAFGIDVQSNDLGFTGTLDNIKVDQLHFNGMLHIEQFTINKLTLDSLSFAVNGRNGKLKVSDKRKKVFDGTISGSALFDFNSKPVMVNISHKAENMDSQLLLRSVESDEYLEGRLNYVLNLDFQSLDWEKAMVSAQGNFNVSGENIVFYGVNIDEALKGFETSGEFNVLNFVAIFLAGPYGSAFANGLDFSHILANYDGERTEVKKLTANWQIKDGLAVAEDVAFATKKYRIAVTGNLDMANKTYQNLTLSLLNKKGCAVLSETINGNFSNPVSSTFKVNGIAFGQVENLWKILSSSSTNNCKPVYNGKITHP